MIKILTKIIFYFIAGGASYQEPGTWSSSSRLFKLTLNQDKEYHESVLYNNKLRCVCVCSGMSNHLGLV